MVVVVLECRRARIRKLLLVICIMKVCLVCSEDLNLFLLSPPIEV